MVEVMQVPSSAIAGIWPSVRDWLAPSVALSRGCYELDDLSFLCEHGAMQLWVAADGERVIGAVVTEITQYPRRRACRVAFAGGTDIKRWYGEADRTIEQWSRTWGCDALMAGGRRGWGKLTKGDEIGVILWRDLDVVPGSTEVH